LIHSLARTGLRGAYKKLIGGRDPLEKAPKEDPQALLAAKLAAVQEVPFYPSRKN
jgi:hypothetical protein